MNPSLIEQRDPILGAVVRCWRAGQAEDLPACLAVHVVRLKRDAATVRWLVLTSGEAVNSIYDADLAGRGACELGPDAPDEADAAMQGGRPILVEETVSPAACPIRLARLYLPLGNPQGDAEMLCCIVEL